MSYAITINGNNYALTSTSQDVNLTLSRTGGQGAKGDSITNASIDSNGDFHVIISNSAGQQVQDVNLGGANFIAAVTTAKTAAEAAADAVDDVFLGSKSSAPSLDNDGNALQNGAMYFDTTTSALGVYNVNTWQYPIALATTSATNAAASATAAASSATSAATSETNAAASKTAAASSATSASSSAASATSSENNAFSSASSATTSASNAATSESNAATSASSASTSATNSAASESNASSHATNAAASSNAASVSESNAASSASSAGSSATIAGQHSANAAANASAATSSATSAATSASDALNFKGDAETAKNAAATSATTAATSATNAATSATSVAADRAAVELAFDNFDDRFLGTKTSDPTVDNDGNTLLEGAMYYNSGTNALKFYNGSSWEAPSVTATNAATSATTSANSATSSATNAATSATNAATSETNAAASAASSLTSANNAAASYDSFDDRYLGAKSSAPSVDNDGDALLTGALYWDSTLNNMYVYTGSAWGAATGSLDGIKMDFLYTATQGQTVFSGTDDNSETLVMDDANLVDVFLNGIKLVQTTDYTLNLINNSITFASGRTVNDIITVQVFGNLSATGTEISGPVITGGTINNSVIGGTTPAAGGFTNITVTGTVDGRDVATDGTKLDGIETGATADQTAAEIRSLVEAATDSNVFTDADHTKLNGIEASANVTDTTNVTAAGALMTTGGSLTGNISLGDNNKAIFGAGSDLQIYHNGNNSYVQDVGTGKLHITSNGTGVSIDKGTSELMATFDTDGAVTLYYDSAAKLATTSTGISVTGNATFADNGKAIFGNSSDLQIYHDGSNSHIKDTATGNLNISGNDIQILNAASNEAMAYFAQDGDVTLYHNGAAKMATTSTGVDITGVLSSDGLTVDSGTNNVVAKFESSDAGAFIVLEDSGSTNDGNRIAVEGDVMSFATGDSERMRISADGSIAINDSSPDGKLNVVSTAHNNGSIFDSTGTTQLWLRDTDAASNQKNWGFQVSGGSLNILRANDDRASGFVTPIEIQQAPANSLVINSSGNVGIGTSSNLLSGSNRTTVSINNTGSAAIAFGVNGTREGHIYSDTSALEISSASNPMRFTAGDSERMRITSTGRVNVGTSATPFFAGVNIHGASTETNLNFADAAIPVLGLANTNTTNNNYSAIAFGDTAAGGGFGSAIAGIMTDHTNNYGETAFFTRSSAGFSEKMRIDTSGNLLVGKPSSSFSTEGSQLNSNGSVDITKSGGAALFVNRLSSDGDIAKFYKNGTTVGSIGAHASNITIGTGATGLRFYDDDNVIMPRNPSTGANVNGTISLGEPLNRFKDLHLSGGVVFDAVAGNATSNTLDDYEEGNWNPTIDSGTVTAENAWYVKVGTLITISAKLSGFSDTSSGSTVTLGGVPFTTKASDHTAQGSMIANYLSNGPYFPYISSNATTIRFYIQSTTNYTTMVHSNLGSSGSFYFTLTYQTQ